MPHGSDESEQVVYYVPSPSSGFISHMVQMKAIWMMVSSIISVYFISHMVQMKDFAGFFGCFRFLYLYIPHGSDERLHGRQTFKN